MPRGRRLRSSSKSAAAPQSAHEPMGAISDSVAQLNLSEVDEAPVVDATESKVEVDSPPVLVTVTEKNAIDLTSPTSPSTPVVPDSPNVPVNESTTSSKNSELYVCAFVFDLS
jgi:hypothetical protein